MSDPKNKKQKSSIIFRFYKPEITGTSSLQVYAHKVPAGFPSPAEDFLEKDLNLNDYLISNKAATFLVRVEGNSMIGAGILPDDLLVIDRSIEPEDGKIVLGVLNGEFTIKRLMKKGKQLFLRAENEDYQPIEITEEMSFQVFGVVTFAIHKV